MSGGLAGLLPKVTLSDQAFASRHRILTIILWLHLPLLVTVALVVGDTHHPGHSVTLHRWMVWGFIAATAVCAVLARSAVTRRGRAIAVSVGMLLAADTLVHAGGGMTDLHFHFFVVLALVSLYQDWVPFALAILLVAGHHLVLGLLVPDLVFSDPRAWAHPLPFVVLHAVFVLAMCAAQVMYWRYSAASQDEAEAIRRRTAEDGAAALRESVEEATRREEAAAADAASQLNQREALAGRLEEVLGAVAAKGVALASDAGEAMSQFQEALGRATSVVTAASGETTAAIDGADGAKPRIAALEAAVANIAAIAGMIQSVADQTNLLALNATIEAARAGEAGRGFGVVANEVKELAAQTAKATAQIEATVAEVTTGTTAVAAVMETVAHRLASVARMQDEITAALAEQTDLAASTRGSVIAAADQVSATVAGFARG